MLLPWYLTAIGAAIAWGIHYPLIDFAMKWAKDKGRDDISQLLGNKKSI